MTENVATVERYMEGFRRSDHAMILACLTEDVEWILPGVYHHRGKKAFDAEIENEAFKGSPEITVRRYTEQNDVVVAEGTVVATMKDGTRLFLAMCDVFEMSGGKISKLVSYILAMKSSA
jgi:uncharacterized protein